MIEQLCVKGELLIKQGNFIDGDKLYNQILLQLYELIPREHCNQYQLLGDIYLNKGDIYRYMGHYHLSKLFLTYEFLFKV